MKKLLIVLITFFSLGLQAQDVTGTWVCAGAYKAEWFQDGQNVYSIYNVSNYKHYLSGRFISANQIEAEVVRINLDNNCRTTLTFRYTLNGNTLTGSWAANDSNCDLQWGQTSSEVLTRTTPSARPMNTFGGRAFSPINDVTGSWTDDSNLEGDWMQDNNQAVHLILNGSGYKQYFRGTRSGNQIRGTMIRYNPSGCRTTLTTTYTQTNANTMQYTWRANDGNCDLANGQTGNVTITRKGK